MHNVAAHRPTVVEPVFGNIAVFRGRSGIVIFRETLKKIALFFPVHRNAVIEYFIHRFSGKVYRRLRALERRRSIFRIAVRLQIRIFFGKRFFFAGNHVNSRIFKRLFIEIIHLHIRSERNPANVLPCARNVFLRFGIGKAERVACAYGERRKIEILILRHIIIEIEKIPHAVRGRTIGGNCVLTVHLIADHHYVGRVARGLLKIVFALCGNARTRL